MFDGRIMGERLPDDTDERQLGLLMAGISDTERDHPVEEVEANLGGGGSELQ
jgi:general nucleoside transport system ATP-binding protein